MRLPDHLRSLKLGGGKKVSCDLKKKEEEKSVVSIFVTYGVRLIVLK